MKQVEAEIFILHGQKLEREWRQKEMNKRSPFKVSITMGEGHHRYNSVPVPQPYSRIEFAHTWEDNNEN